MEAASAGKGSRGRTGPEGGKTGRCRGSGAAARCAPEERGAATDGTAPLPLSQPWAPVANQRHTPGSQRGSPGRAGSPPADLHTSGRVDLRPRAGPPPRLVPPACDCRGAPRCRYQGTGVPRGPGRGGVRGELLHPCVSCLAPGVWIPDNQQDIKPESRRGRGDRCGSLTAGEKGCGVHRPRGEGKASLQPQSARRLGNPSAITNLALLSSPWCSQSLAPSGSPELLPRFPQNRPQYKRGKNSVTR